MAVQEDDVYEITDSPATSDLTEPEEEKETKPSRSRSGEHTRQRRISRAEHPTQKHHRRTSTDMAVRGGDDGSVYEIPDSEEEQEAERERENDRNLRKAIEMSKQSHTDEPAQKQHRTITQKDDIVEIPDERNERKLRKASETEQRALDVTLKTFDFNSSATRAMAAATTNPTVASSSSSSSARQNTTKVLKRKQFVSLVSDEEDDEKLKRPETQKQQQVSKKPRTRKDSPEALQPVQKSSGIMDRGALIEARLAKYQATGTTNSRSTSASGGGNGSREGSNDGVPPQSFYGSGNIIGGNYVDSLKVVPSVPSPIPVQDTATEDGIPLVDLEEVKPTTLKQTSAALTPATDPPTTAKDGWYPTGVVKKTWLENQNNGSDTIQIEGVLQKETLVTTLLSSFQWDYEWIMGHLPLHRKDHNMIFVMQGKEEADRQMTQAIFGGLARIELVFPPMDGQVNCMHSKLMLLFHKKGDREWLRIAIPTANLTNYDWGLMTGVMENVNPSVLCLPVLRL